jgi:Kef-type K+ transport system membrane component KefB
MGTTEVFLIAIAIIFTVPWLIWRVGRTDYYARCGRADHRRYPSGPGILGKIYPDYYAFVFTQPVIQSLNGIALWGVMIFVWIAGVELDLSDAWANRRESAITAGLALVTPLLLGSIVAGFMAMHAEWVGATAMTGNSSLAWDDLRRQLAAILILLMEKLEVLRQPVGQRILRYASLDDIAIWAVLALILMEWQRVGMQAAFLVAFGVCSFGFRKLMRRCRKQTAGMWADLARAVRIGRRLVGLHYIVGAFIAGAVIDGDWFDRKQMDMLRQHVLLIVMPVFFLSTGLKTNWSVGGQAVFVAAAVLLVASVGGKLLGVHAAGRVLRWQPGEASIIGWMLQTKG